MLSLLLTTFIALSPLNTPYPQVLEAIAMCESGATQYTSEGSVIRDHVYGTHVGVFQLSTQWQKQAQKFGMDVVNSEKDNITMAIWIYNKYGTAPWLASKPCWVDYAVGKNTS